MPWFSCYRACARYGDRPFLGERPKAGAGPFKWVTFKEFDTLVNQCRVVMKAAGVGKGDKASQTHAGGPLARRGGTASRQGVVCRSRSSATTASSGLSAPGEPSLWVSPAALPFTDVHHHNGVMGIVLPGQARSTCRCMSSSGSRSASTS
jgi:hypothetical protein